MVTASFVLTLSLLVVSFVCYNFNFYRNGSSQWTKYMLLVLMTDKTQQAFSSYKTGVNPMKNVLDELVVSL